MKGGVLTPEQEVENKETSRRNRQEIVCRPPGYLSDDLWMDSGKCMITGEPFTLLRRCHHCRTCGIAVCGEKSEKQRVHKYIDKDTKRILSDDSNQRRCQWCIDDTTDYSLNCIPEFANVQSRLYWAMGADKYRLSDDVVNSVGDLLVELHKSQEKKHQKIVLIPNKEIMTTKRLDPITLGNLSSSLFDPTTSGRTLNEYRVTIHKLLEKLKEHVETCELEFSVIDEKDRILFPLTGKEFENSSLYLDDAIRIHLPKPQGFNVTPGGIEQKNILHISASFKYQQGE